MELNIRGSDNRVVMAPSGDVDLSTSREFQGRLHAALNGRPALLIVDLGLVPYMDSSGVATLVEAMQIARRQSTRLVLCALQEKVRSIFEIARLDRVFTIVADEQSAG